MEGWAEMEVVLTLQEAALAEGSGDLGLEAEVDLEGLSTAESVN
jgi:hypothetical protein